MKEFLGKIFLYYEYDLLYYCLCVIIIDVPIFTYNKTVRQDQILYIEDIFKFFWWTPIFNTKGEEISPSRDHGCC